MREITVTGGRTYDKPWIVFQKIRELTGDEVFLLRHGRCPPRDPGGRTVPWDAALASTRPLGLLGADWYAFMYARIHRTPVKEFPADWSLGKGAGHIRNGEMLADGPRAHVLGFVEPQSRGTVDCLRRAEKLEMTWTAYDKEGKPWTL